MRVEVTQADIKAGWPRVIGGCPVALAMRRIPGFEHATVGTKTAGDVLTWGDFELPSEAQQFIAEFDAGGKVEPFSFQLSKLCAKI